MRGFLALHSSLENANLAETAVWIHAGFSTSPPARQLDFAFLLEANKRLLRNVYVGPNNPCISGVLRKTHVVVRTPHGIYQPPEPDQVPALLNSRLYWLSLLKARQVPTLSRAIQLAIAVCAIHPFMEGNGRTARMASLAMLLGEGYRYRREGTLEEYLGAERKRWMIGMWLAVKGSLSELSTLYNEAVSVLMQRPALSP